jgi:Asp-tRNA(Asn)/Glu-tRNA(Gln) amidotransferase A subunit family amidase
VADADALTDLGVVEAADWIRRGEISATALVEASLARIADDDPTLGAWVTVDADGARAAAAALDRRLATDGPAGPLHGIPVGIKDIIDVAGLPTTNGAPPFAHTRPTRDATLVARLRDAGAIIVGTTVATQFAYLDPAPTRNPWAADRTPGGSSSGSAAAVAARHVPVAIGTQTVGSILRPAAYCGVVGLKGPFGAVPLDGVAPLARSFDHVGPIARSVADAALVGAVLRGEGLETVVLARPRLGLAAGLLRRAEPALGAAIDGLLARLERDDATLVPIDLPPIDGLVAAGRLTLAVEAAEAHRHRFAIHGDDYAPAIAGLVRHGLSVPERLATEARRTVASARAAIAPSLVGIDALITPVAPGPAPIRGAGTGDFTLCAPWSFIGVPALSLPIGLDADGLPLAIQLIGDTAGLGRLLGAAARVEALAAFEARPAS